jgi:ABC-type Mn2+/Zn2+ transport system permease subunit/Mn-dependent DtxR family transcriptional regulator
LGLNDVWIQVARFFSFRDPALRDVLLGALLTGASCGVMGGYLLVRRMALMGDTLAHAVLPGVAVAFLVRGEKDPVAILLGAVTAGILGALLVPVLKRYARLKEDAAMAWVLSVFFAAGACLVSIIQRTPGGNKSGLESFLFGQAAAIGRHDILLLGSVFLLVLICVMPLFRGLLCHAFDPLFARSIGLPSRTLEIGLMSLTACVVVASLQATGVVMVTALLIIPAATARLLTHRLAPMLVISAALGAAAGLTGAFLSFLRGQLPTGPLMVLSSAALFVAVWMFAPRLGALPAALAARKHRRRVAVENMVKSLYKSLENSPDPRATIPLSDLALDQGKPIRDIRRLAERLEREESVSITPEGICLLPSGKSEARRLIRNHRLWELYLVRYANFAPDHVHDDAEEVEHLLHPDLVRALDEKLNRPVVDPHGSPIPANEDVGTGGHA